MKRCLSGLLALLLTAALCAGCGAKTDPPSGIYYDITGIDPKSTAYKVGDVEFPAEMYLYWLAYSCSSLEYDMNMYHMYFGAYEEMFDEDGNLLWDAVFMDGMTLSEYAKQDAQNNLLFYAVIENKAKDLGLELSEDDRAALDADFNDMVESMGGQEAFDENMELMGISRESFDRISSDAKLFEKMTGLVLEEGSPLYISPEEFEEQASYTDHILLSTKDMETEEPLSDEKAAEKYSTAQDLLAQLRAVGDVEALFDQLAGEYSEDPGRAEGKGYLVTADTNFVEEFLDTALTMKPGEVSDIVESTYGYHILYRRNLSDMLTDEDWAGLAEDTMYTQVNNDMAQLQLDGSEEIDAIDAGEFYASYNAKVEEIMAAKETAEGGSTDSDSADGGAAGSTDNGGSTDGGNE